MHQQLRCQQQKRSAFKKGAQSASHADWKNNGSACSSSGKQYDIQFYWG